MTYKYIRNQLVHQMSIHFPSSPLLSILIGHCSNPIGNNHLSIMNWLGGTVNKQNGISSLTWRFFLYWFLLNVCCERGFKANYQRHVGCEALSHFTIKSCCGFEFPFKLTETFIELKTQ